MKQTISRLVLAAALLCAFTAAANGQGGTTSTLSGVVVDEAGGVIPGATVSVKNDATGVSFEAVTNEAGAFSVPALPAGTYTVTVSLAGFKTSVINDVRLQAAIPGHIKATLSVGNLEETITVSSRSEVVQTQSSAISSTMNVDQINAMPLATRNALNALIFLPGVNTSGTNRNSNFNGLPDSFVAISLDGVNNNDNYNKSSEGLFAMVTPRQDAVEAVTVTTAGNGADVGGHGAVQISFVTRQGTNQFNGSVYHYFRAPELNTNYAFNKINGLPRNEVVLHQYGFRQGGPIVIPKLYNGRGKSFFFANHEKLKLPNNVTRTRTIFDPRTQSGIFRYNVTVGGQTQVREVNVLALAAANGNITSLDPTIARVLSTIRAATQTTGTINPNTDPNTMSYVFQSGGKQYEDQTTVRLDHNLTNNHRLTGSYNTQVVSRDPDHLNGGDVRFPGLPNYSKYISYRELASWSMRSTFSKNIVNEVRGGGRWGDGFFGADSSNGPQTFENQDGFALNLPLVEDLDTENGPTWRGTPSWNIDDTVNVLRGEHSFSFGGSLYFGGAWAGNKQIVPSIDFGVPDQDPAVAMFSSANFQGASQGQLDNAEALYALLTGRVSAINGQAQLNEEGRYEYLGTRIRRGQMNEYSLFAQDSWRMMPNLTINAGVRWDLQTPFEPKNDVFATATYADLCGRSGIGADGECNFFRPGTLTGIAPRFVQYDSGNPGYKTDWNNVAPNVGFAWRPNIESGFLRTILGDPEQATLRGAYSLAYTREGMGIFVGQFGANPGSQITVNRNTTNGLIVPAGQTWPVLLQERHRLGPAPFPETTQYPILASRTDSHNIDIFDPNIQVAHARSYSIGFQRALSKDMAVEIRYVGTRGRNQWSEENYNDVNIIENGFLDEFRRAQANLQANLAAGRGGTFAYFGPGTGTSPLPTYLAYFTGVSPSQAGNPARYTTTSWTNGTFVNRLSQVYPRPFDAADDLHGNATRRGNALTAGVAPNFFVLNPDVGSARIYKSNAFSSYDALQVDLRRRLSKGLSFQANYQYALEEGSVFLGQRYGRISEPSTGTVRHAFKTLWDYSVPVGRGRRFGSDMNRFLDGVIGGWEFHGTGRVQNRVVNVGNVRLVGMSPDELQDAYKIRFDKDPITGRTRVWHLPEDIILNTRRAYNTLATSQTGYSDLGVPEGRYIAPANNRDCIQLKTGDCAAVRNLVLHPLFTRFDMSFVKKFGIVRRVNFELRLDVLNVFNNVNFNVPVDSDGDVNLAGTSADIARVTSGYTDFNNTFDPGGRLGQIVWRINW